MKKILVVSFCIVLISSVAIAQDVPKVEIFGGYSLMRLGGEDMSESFDFWDSIPAEWDFPVSSNKWFKKGFMASATFNINEYFSIEGNFQYNTNTVVKYHWVYLDNDVQGGADLSDFSFMAGPRFAIRKNEAITPFAHFLLGVNRVKMSTYYDTCIADGTACDPADYDHIESDMHIANFHDNGFALAFGGGLDLNASESIAIRAIQVDYIRADQTVNIPELQSDDASFDMGNLNLAFGIVFKLGQ